MLLRTGRIDPFGARRLLGVVLLLCALPASPLATAVDGAAQPPSQVQTLSIAAAAPVAALSLPRAAVRAEPPACRGERCASSPLPAWHLLRLTVELLL